MRFNQLGFARVWSLMHGLFDISNNIHKWSLAYTVVDILQDEMEEFVLYWNSHPLRRNRIALCPHGIPDDIFEMPENYGNW